MKKSLLLASLVCLLTFSAKANEIIVNSPADYASSYAAAQNGDVLKLYSGVYAQQNFPAGKYITVAAASDTSDVNITGEVRFDGEVGEGAGICFEGVTLGEGASYLFNFAFTGSIKEIKLKNCIIHDVNRCTIYLTGGAATCLENLVFDGCTLNNLNSGNWNMMWPTTPIKNITFNECTFYDNNGMESIYLPRENADYSHTFTFTHNTFFTGCRDANRRLCDVQNKFAGEDCALTIKDNVIICPDGQSAGELFNISAGWWEVNISNNLIVGWGVPGWNDEIGEAAIENNFTLEDLGIANIGAIFADPANGNFTLYKGISPLEGKASDGGVLGASKWLQDAGTLFTLTRSLAEGVDEAAGSISGPSGLVAEGTEITLTANKNFGFKFSKWVDQTGATLSTDASYSFVMDADKTVLAVFDAVNLFKLNIQCVGGGSVIVSEAGKDGEYEYFEEGTELVLTAKTNKITEFVMWEDFTGELNRNIVMDKDYDIVATFETIDYICGWNFDLGLNEASQNRVADLVSDKYADKENLPILSLYYTYAPDAPWTSGWWNRTDDDHQAAVTWLRCTELGDGTEFKTETGAMDSSKYFTDQGFYWQTCLNTKGYEGDVIFLWSMKRTYMGHYDYFTEVSYDGLSWEKVGKHTNSGSWQDFSDTIPYSTNKEALYIRLIPDVTSGYDADRIFDVYGVYVADMYFIADATNAINKAESSFRTAVNNGMLNVRANGVNRASLFSVDGKMVRSSIENGDFNWNTSSLKGIYILKVGNHISKINF